MNQYHIIQADINTFLHRWDADTGKTVDPLKGIELFQLEIIGELRQSFPDSVQLQDIDLPAILAHINADTNEKFILIIDEWDAIFREDTLNTIAQEAYLTLLQGLLKDATSKRFLKLAYLYSLTLTFAEN